MTATEDVRDEVAAQMAAKTPKERAEAIAKAKVCVLYVLLLVV